MANVNITTSECAWANFEVKILGRTVKGIKGFSFKKTVEKELLYGAGDDSLDITTGNKKGEGSLKLLGFEVDSLNKIAGIAQYEDITEVPHEEIVITCSYRRRLTDPMRTIIATGVGFTETGIDMEQNAKHREVQLPFIAMNVEFL